MRWSPGFPARYQTSGLPSATCPMWGVRQRRLADPLPSSGCSRERSVSDPERPGTRLAYAVVDMNRADLAGIGAQDPVPAAHKCRRASTRRGERKLRQAVQCGSCYLANIAWSVVRMRSAVLSLIFPAAFTSLRLSTERI